MKRGRLITLAAVLSAVALTGAAAHAASTVSESVSASLSRSGGNSGALTLKITRNGRVAYRRRVGAPGCARCSVVAVPPGRQSLHVLDLESDGDLDVVLGLFSGGANCCFIDQVFRYSPATRTYIRSQHNFRNAGAAISTIGGKPVLMSGDSRITEAGFTDTADSGTPIQIWRFAHGKFTDVTRSYRKLIRADAAKWMRLFNHHLANGVGLIAAWAADEDLLGQSALVDRTLKSLAAQDKLRTPLGLPHNSETQFVTQLEKLLHKLGYTH